MEYVAERGRDGLAVYRGGASIVEDHLREVVKTVFGSPAIGPTIIKRRYIERAFGQKVFSLIPSLPVVNPLDLTLRSTELGDLQVVADFGHGLIDAEVATKLVHRCSFLALTVQSNSLNWGFNLLTKYPSANYVVVDETELRLACGDALSDIMHLLIRQNIRMGCQQFAVTLGHKGCIIYDSSYSIKAPALTEKVTDRMGAGDAFLAWTAPLVKLGAPKEVVAFVGNVAAGIKVGMVGNQVVTKAKVIEWTRNLLG